MSLVPLLLASLLHFGPQYPVTPPVPAASPYEQFLGEAAASADVALVVWAEAGGHIAAARVGRDGERLDTRAIALSGSDGFLPKVVRGAGKWLVVWVESSTVYGRFVGDDGVAGERLTIGGLDLIHTLRIAFDGTHYLVAWNSNSGTSASLVDAEGGVSYYGRLLPARSEFAVAALDSGFAVVAVGASDDASTIEVFRFTTDAELYAYSWLDETSTATLSEVHAIADGDTLVATWESSGRVFIAREHQPLRVAPIGTTPLGIMKIGGAVHVLMRDVAANEAWLVSEDGSRTRRVMGVAPWPAAAVVAAASFGDRALFATSDGDIRTSIIDASLHDLSPVERLAFEPALQEHPAIARAGQESLAVWVESGHDGPPSLDAVRLDSAGRPLGDAFTIGTGTRSVRPHVASDGAGYVVAWDDDSVRARHIRPDGTLGAVADLGDSLREVCIAWNGTEYLVGRIAFGEETGMKRTVVQVTRVSFDGVAGAVSTISGLDQHLALSCASAGDRTLFAWQDSNGVSGSVMSTGGTTTGVFPIGRFSQPTVASDGERFAVAWMNQNHDTERAIVSREGTVSPVNDAVVFDAEHPRLAATRDGWVLAWNDGAITRLMPLDRDGRTAGPTRTIDANELALAGGDAALAIYTRELEPSLLQRWRVFTRTISSSNPRRRAARH